MVCLGNSEMVAPLAGVEFWATKDTEKFPANRNMMERKVYTNALLTLSFGEGDPVDPEMDKPMGMEEEAFNLYNSRMAIPDAIFDTDMDVTIIPGFKEGALPRRIINICTEYAAVFKKSLTADKRTKFKPATLPLIAGARPSRRPTGCRKTPLHWKGVIGDMLDSLLEANMIK